MRKVGVERFTMQVLHATESVDEAVQAEQLWIDHFKRSADWCLLNDAPASPPKSKRRFKKTVEQYLSRLVDETPIGGELPGIRDTARAMGFAGITVQRCYQALRDAGRIRSPGGGNPYRRVA
jgi:hypothetical protein